MFFGIVVVTRRVLQRDPRSSLAVNNATRNVCNMLPLEINQNANVGVRWRSRDGGIRTHDLADPNGAR